MYYQFVSVALVIRHAKILRHVVICGLPGFTIFLLIVSQKARVSKEKKVFEHQTCVANFSTNLSEHFSYSKETADINIDFHVHYAVFCQIIMTLVFSLQI